MVPILYARFFTDVPALYEKVKEVAKAQGYAVTVDDPEKGLLHFHKKATGKTVHLIVHLGRKSERSVAVEVMPGDEGSYMDFGRHFIEGMHKAVR